jgi:thioredoxin reductase (NADPH)
MTATAPDRTAQDSTAQDSTAQDSTAQDSLAATPDTYGAFPRLSDAQLAELAELGARRHAAAGEILIREGHPSDEFLVVLAGKAGVCQGYGTLDERMVEIHGPGRFLGELGLLTGQAALSTTLVLEPGEVLAVPMKRLREMATGDLALTDLILRACLVRRWMLTGLGPGLRIVGSRYSPGTRRLREFAARNRLPYRWVDLEDDRPAEALLRDLGVAADETPVVVWDGALLRNPSDPRLAGVVGLPAPTSGASAQDLVVVGAGPAGLAATAYGASEGLATVALEAAVIGGQAGTSARIDNYLGFPAGISGADLAARAAAQARTFGARFSVPAKALRIGQVGGYHVIELTSGETIEARTVVLATGARYQRLDVPCLEQFEGASVFYAATEAEAQLCAHNPVAIVGSGNSAGEAALFLARRACAVRLVVRGGDFSPSMSRYLVDQIERCPAVEVLPHTEVREVQGDGRLQEIIVEDNRTGERRRFDALALFVFIGAVPATEWLGNQIALDDYGFVRTGAAALRPRVRTSARARPGSSAADRTQWRPSSLETSRPGLFAVGDVRSGSIKRVGSAVGEGAMVVRLVRDRLYR